MTWDTITFDCYGTLVDWEAGISGAFIDAAGEDGVELTAEGVIAAYHETEPQVQTGVYRPYRDVLQETAMRVADIFGWALAPERAGFLSDTLPDWPVFEDTRSALGRLKHRFRLAILSNIEDDLLAATIERIGVDFDWTVTAEQVRSYKPSPGHFRKALERLQGRREPWLHVARSYFHDIRPASELGVSTVWVNRKQEAQPNGPAPTHVVRDLRELADWLGA